LAVHFGKEDVDYAKLEQYNPLPLMADEREEDVDNCIFKGHLMNEPDAEIVMTGGCPFTLSFEAIESVAIKKFIFLYLSLLFQMMITSERHNS